MKTIYVLYFFPKSIKIRLIFFFPFFSVITSLATQLPHADANGNNDSGYAASNLSAHDEAGLREVAGDASPGPRSPRDPRVTPAALAKGKATVIGRIGSTYSNKNGSTASPRGEKVPLR